MIGTANFSDEFDAVAQIVERGYPVAEVSKRLGVSQYSLYAWKRKFSQAQGSGDGDKDAEIGRLKRELTRVTEERDILRERPRISPRMQSEIRVRRRASPAVFGASDVSLPAHPPERLLCLTEEPAEQTSSGRHSPDRTPPQGLD
jgi:transposase-like protein